MEKTTIYLTSEQRRAIDRLAHMTGKSRGALIREAIDAYIATHTTPRSGTPGTGAGGRLHVDVAGDELRKGWASHQSPPV